jgi:hypothetical protein
LADGATDQAPGSAVGTLALAGTSSSPSRRRCRAPQAPSTGPWFGVPAGGRVVVVVRDVCPVPCRVEVALSEYSVASTRPRVRCPVSGVDVRCPGVGCPHVRVRVRGVCTGDFMERVDAAGSHTARRARVWPSRRVPERHDHRPEPGWLLVRTVWRRSGCVAQAGGGDHAPWSPWRSRAEWPGRCEPS